MVEVINFADSFYRPSSSLSQGLEALVRFPDGDVKRTSVPNSSVWVYSADGHTYKPQILGSDVGCGIAAFFISEVDQIAATDKIYDHLAGKGILGRGNHFVDVCSAFSSAEDIEQRGPHNMLIVHTHGKNDFEIITSIDEAQKRQTVAEAFRKQLGEELAERVGATSCEMLGNWTHNSAEQDDKLVIYRKGVVKVAKEKVYILPAHIGARIAFYTVSDEMIDGIQLQMPPYNSMPHATGRRGPRGETKASLEEVVAMRRNPAIPYIPSGISDNALRTEHPSCFNDDDGIFKRLRYQLTEHFDHPYPILLGSCIIKGYVGKV